MKNYLFYILLIFIIWSCKQNEVNGIEIGQTLYSNQSYGENKKLTELITQTLGGNSKSIAELVEFDCGGGEGCYDLGHVCTQLVYKIGETDFMKMTTDLNDIQKSSLKGLLDVGFEYGNYKDKTTETEFPRLTGLLTGERNILESNIEEPIEVYNLRKSIIVKQNLDVWPDLIDIKKLEKESDSLILFMAEIDGENYLRISRASDLSRFSEMEYKNDCRQEGTISTDLKIGKINNQKGKIEILCLTKNYTQLEIKN